MASNKSIKKNYLYNLSYQILQIVVPIITTPYVARVLGVSGVGTFSFANSIVSYFLIVAILGTATFGQREISYFQNSLEERSKAFWEIIVIRAVATTIAAITYVLMVFFLNFENRELYLILAIEIFSAAFDMSWYYQGQEEFGKIVGTNTIIRIIQVVFIFIFVKTPSDLPLYAFGISVIRMFGNISLIPNLRKSIVRIPTRNLHPLSKLKGIMSLFIPTIAIQIYTVLDKTMIGVITHDTIENGYYEQAEKISKLVLTIVVSLSTVMIPHIGALFAENKTEEIQQDIYRCFNFIWMVGVPLCFGLIGISGNLVPWFFGSGYEGVIPVLCILSFLILAIGDNNAVAFAYLVPTKRQRIFTTSVTIGAIVNFIGNLLLIKYFASIGAAIASVLAEITICVYLHLSVRREISISHILKLSTHYLLAGILMFFALLLEGIFLNSSIISTMILVLTGVIVYFGTLLLIRDRFFVEAIDVLLNKICKKN